MSQRAYVPDASDVVWLEFDPQAGYEQADHRPAWVISPAGYKSKTGLMVCCPMSHEERQRPRDPSGPPGPRDVVPSSGQSLAERN